jgi:hypothetical protein
MFPAGSHGQLAVMQTRGSKKLILLGACAVIAACATQVCLAGPPAGAQKNLLPGISATPNPTQNSPHFLAARLDLRAPAHAAPLEQNTTAFPSALIHRQIGGGEQTVQLPSLGAGSPRIRPPLAELARHLQHEGLPVARLWENNSALVHIGLNQRGKPGLWLVQKVH